MSFKTKRLMKLIQSRNDMHFMKDVYFCVFVKKSLQVVVLRQMNLMNILLHHISL
jgi:hypothetical protein